MVELAVTPRFERAYRKLTDEQRDRVDLALETFVANPRHPGLHFERLKASDYRTFRVDRKKLRVVLRDLGAHHYELIDVDNHNSVDRSYG